MARQALFRHRHEDWCGGVCGGVFAQPSPLFIVGKLQRQVRYPVVDTRYASLTAWEFVSLS